MLSTTITQKEKPPEYSRGHLLLTNEKNQYPGFCGTFGFTSVSLLGIGKFKWRGNWKDTVDKLELKKALFRLIIPCICHLRRSNHLWPSPASSLNLSSIIHCMIVPLFVSAVEKFAGSAPAPLALVLTWFIKPMASRVDPPDCKTASAFNNKTSANLRIL